MQTTRALAAAMLAAVAATSFADILFEENFRHYKDTVPGVTEAEGLELINEPIWSQSAWLALSPKTSFRLFKDDIALPAGNKFDLLVKFCLNYGDEPSYFDITLANKAGKSQSVRIAADAIAGSAIDKLGNGQWEDLVVKADGANADVYLSKSHVFGKVASVKLADAYDALNFAVTAGKGFSCREIVVRTPDALPDYSAETLFASFKSLSQPLADAKVAVSNETFSLPLAGRPGVSLVFGSTNTSAEVQYSWSNGAVTKDRFRAGDHKEKIRPALFGKPGNTEHVFPDAVIECSNHAFRQFVRPSFWPYGSLFGVEQHANDIFNAWDRLPKATQHVFNLEFVRRDDGVLTLYIDGSFRGAVNPPRLPKSADGTPPPAPSVTNITFTLSEGVRYAIGADRLAGFDKDRFEVLNLAANPKAKAFADAAFAAGTAAGRTTVEGVPLEIVEPLDSQDVSICKTSKNPGFELWDCLGRSPEQGYPSEVHFRVPSATYTKAHVVFALDPDKGKDAILTLRLSHFVDHGVGHAMVADTGIDFTGGIPEGVRKVGEVVKDGRKIPLYYAAVDLDIGKIVDFTTRHDYMDVDIVGKCIGHLQQRDLRDLIDPTSQCAFNLFAVTLEKAPVVVDFVQQSLGNIFTIDEAASVRKTAVVVKAVRDNVSGKVAWTARDADGKEVFKGEKAFALAAAGSSNVVEVALDKVGVGYYKLDYSIAASVAGAGASFDHHASFAIVPPAGRKVKRQVSPYATWRYAIGDAPDEFALDGPVIHKAGIKRAAFRNYTPEQSAKYDVTSCGNVVALHHGQFDGATGKFKPGTIRVPDPADPNGRNTIPKEIDGEEAFVRDLKGKIDGSYEVDHVLVWHESAPWNQIPEELLGRPLTQTSRDNVAGDKLFADYIREVHRLVRKHFPGLRVEIGNTGASIGAVVRPLRADKSVADCYDAIATECCGQSMPPERLIEVGLQSSVIARDAFRALAGREPVMNGCYEFTYRCERDLGERKQAEFYMRDILVSLSHDFSLISPGVLLDVTGGYYNTGWGASGILTRRPYAYPKPSYAAYAALTYALDGVTFIRQLDTGSSTVYALEFKRCDGKYAYALWAARGEVKFGIDTPVACTLVGFFGAESKVAAGKQTVDGGTSPVYLVADKPLKGVTIEGRSFAEDTAVAEGAKVAAALDKAEDCFLDPDPLMASTHANFLPILEPGDFTLAQVKDDEKGDCIKVALNTEDGKQVSNYVTEYTTLRLKEPKALEGTPEVIGVWVKGNSNWGQIRFEIEDAEGEVFKGLSSGKAWGCDIYDWPCYTAVNFDGWNYVYAPLRQTPLASARSPATVEEQWVSCGGGNKRIDYPVKVRAITVGMNRHKLNLNEFEESAPMLRFRDIGGK